VSCVNMHWREVAYHNTVSLEVLPTSGREFGLIAMTRRKQLQEVSFKAELEDLMEEAIDGDVVDAGAICGTVTDAELSLLSKGCSMLRRLDLWGCSHCTDIGIARVASGGPKLRVLNLGRLHQLTDGGLRPLIAACQSLQSVDLSGCTQVSVGSVVSLLENCQNLQALHIGGLRDLSGEQLSLSPGCAVRLRAVNMCGCTHMRDSFVSQLTVAAPNLMLLDFQGSRSITDNTLQYLSTRVPGLAAINLAGCTGITDDGLEQLAAGCRGLQAVSLANISTIGDTGVDALLRGCSLAFLSVKNCTELTDYSLEAVAKGCPNLNNLDVEITTVEANPAFSEAAFCKVFASCPALQGFNCGGRVITDAVLEKLAQNCPNLLHLAVHQCHSITAEGVQAILAGCPSIEALDLDGCLGVDSDDLMNLDELGAVEEQLKAFVLPDSHSVEAIDVAVLKKQLAMGVPPAYQQKKLTQSGVETMMEKIWSWSAE